MVRAKKRGGGGAGLTLSWVLSAAVDVEARVKEGDGQQAALHPPLPRLYMSISPTEQQRENKAE